MSIRQMTQVWDLDLRGAEQIVLLALADWADDDGGHLFPSQAKLAWKVGYSVRQVQRILGDLILDGGLEIVAKPRRGKTTEYRLHLDRMARKPAYVSQEWDDNMSPQPLPDGATSTPNGATPTTEWGDTHVAPIRQEPSEEPSKTGAALASRKRDPIWDAFTFIFGAPTQTARGAWNAAAKVLRDYGASGDEIVAFATGAVNAGNDRFVITPTALAKHYGSRAMLTKLAPKPDHAAELMREALRG